MNHREYARRWSVGIVRNLRKELGITQKELAEKMGIKQSGIARIEAGHQNPTIHWLRKCARATGRFAVFTFEKEPDMRIRTDTPTNYFKITL